MPRRQSHELPETIRVGYRTYHLGTHPAPSVDGGPVWGYCDKARGIIVLHEEMPDKEVFKDTLLHEILHAIFSEYNLKDDMHEEDTVHGVATGLTQVFLDNPEIGKILCKK